MRVLPSGSMFAAAFVSFAVLAQAAEQTSPAVLRQSIHAALRAESSAEGQGRSVAIRQLTELYEAVAEHPDLSDASRRQLSALLRARLKRIARDLAQPTARPQEPAAPAHAASSATPNPLAILAQIQGNPPAAPAQGAAPVPKNPGPATSTSPASTGDAFAAQTVANADQLIELIQNTIAPKSWDVRGGRGTIRYFAPSQVLVIRQTDGIHAEVDAALSQMRSSLRP